MCNYIVQNIIFLLFLGVYYFIFLRKRREYWLYLFKLRKKEKIVPKNIYEATLDTLGWQFFVGSIIFTIVYFVNREGVLSDIFKAFGIEICNI